MPYINKWGDQVTLELVRQLLEFSGYYFKAHENRGVMKKISKLSFFAAINHPKGGKNDIQTDLKGISLFLIWYCQMNNLLLISLVKFVKHFIIKNLW